LELQMLRSCNICSQLNILVAIGVV